MKGIHRTIVIVAALGVLVGTSALMAQKPAPETVVLTGAPMGGVKLAHKVHGNEYGKCENCHHASKAEKPNTSETQACKDCHTKAAAAPMKTKYQNAFHDGTAKKGTCVDCHAEVNAKGKSAPMKCPDCHKKENK